MGAGGGASVAGSIELICGHSLLAMSGVSLDFAGWAMLAQSDVASEAPGLLTVVVTQVWLWLRVAIGIGLVIFVHELGHFLAAKWCGVKVEKFYVGFDVPIRIGPIRFPRTLGKFRYGETEYGIGTIPLGGYVKMLGQDDDPRRMEEEARRIRQESGDEAAGDEAEIDRPVKLDPRSFPAKTVWQRMLIISAGVVMNLITGVMFAAAAFLYGVPYLPAVVGDVTPGSPAFEAGIRPGGKVVGVGGISKDNHLYFTDMATAIMLEGASNPEQPVSVAIEYPDGIRNYELRTAEVAAVPGLRRIGISNITTNFLPASEKRLAATDSAAASVLTEADAGAEVITIDGQPVVGVGNRDNVPGSVMVQQRIAARPNQPVTLGLLRTDGSTAEVVVPPQPMSMPGMELAIGPVNGIVAGGPAAKAGVKRGDVLVAVDGETRIGPFSLPSLLADIDRPVKMTFRRADGSESTDTELELTPAAPSRTSTPFNTLDNSIALDRFGLSYKALPKVAFVNQDADGQSPWQAGDVVKKVAVKWPGDVVPEAFSDKVFAPLRKRLAEGWEFNNEYTLSTLVDLWQFFPDGTQLTVTVSRNDEIVEIESSLADTGNFWFDRGIRFAELERTHVADGLGQAVALGLQASQRRLTEVFRFLGMLVSGKGRANMVGGPITIFRAAGQETSRGVPALLMFLTMLSMNLAILNFLPIPALDGGHMVFLTTEAVLGRPVNEKLQMQLTMAGVLALLSLMAFAIFNDIRRF